MVIELISDEDTTNRRGRKRKVISCNICGSKETKLQSNGKPIWIEDWNSKGNKNGEYLCYKCRYEIPRVCSECGNEDSVLHRIYDDDGCWIGVYKCRTCFRKKIKKKNGDDKKNGDVMIFVDEVDDE